MPGRPRLLNDARGRIGTIGGARSILAEDIRLLSDFVRNAKSHIGDIVVSRNSIAA